MSRLQLATVAAAALATTFFAGAARADSYLYTDVLNSGAYPTTSFGTIDLSTGAFTAIDNDESYPLSLAAYGGVLYAAIPPGYAPAADENTLYKVNVTTGALTAVGQFGSATAAASGLGSTTTGLYAFGGVEFLHFSLLSVSPSSGAATLVQTSSTAFGCGNWCALSGSGASLFAMMDHELYSVGTTSNGDWTDLGDAGLPSGIPGASGAAIGALTYQNGTLYGFDNDNGWVETVNTSTPSLTGLVKLTGVPGGSFVYGLAPDPLTTAVPESPTWALLVAGFAGLGFAAYRKRRPAISIA